MLCAQYWTERLILNTEVCTKLPALSHSCVYKNKTGEIKRVANQDSSYTLFPTSKYFLRRQSELKMQGKNCTMTCSASPSHYSLQKLECGPAKEGREAFSPKLFENGAQLWNSLERPALRSLDPNIKCSFQISNQRRKLTTSQREKIENSLYQPSLTVWLNHVGSLSQQNCAIDNSCYWRNQKLWQVPCFQIICKFKRHKTRKGKF